MVEIEWWQWAVAWGGLGLIAAMLLGAIAVTMRRDRDADEASEEAPLPRVRPGGRPRNRRLDLARRRAALRVVRAGAPGGTAGREHDQGEAGAAAQGGPVVT